MSVKYKNDLEYASEKLCGSDIFYNGEIVYVKEILNYDDKDLAYLYSYSTDVDFQVPIEEIDLEPPKLGYINLRDQSFYVTRLPKKYWKQGQNKNNILTDHGVVGGSFYKDLCKNYRVTYPTFEESLERVFNNECLSRAFNKNFSIINFDDSLKLEYKKHIVGNIKSGSWEPQLSGKFLMLKEALNECLN